MVRDIFFINPTNAPLGTFFLNQRATIILSQMSSIAIVKKQNGFRKIIRATLSIALFLFLENDQQAPFNQKSFGSQR